MSINAALDTRQHILDIAKPLMLEKGFTAMGLSELLAAATIPKGSFYHYFSSKEAFGEALLDTYFEAYLERMDAFMQRPGTGADCLMRYWTDWIETHESGDPEGRCLAVKLGAEVCDLSERMRGALERGTSAIIARLAAAIERGQQDGSLSPDLNALGTATSLYQLWLGSSLLVKINRSSQPVYAAMDSTRQLLNLSL